MVSRNEVYAAIDTERAYQDKRWNELDNVEPMTIAKTITLLHAYIRKLEDAWVGEVGYDEAAHVLRKIAGIAVAGLENTNAPKRTA